MTVNFWMYEWNNVFYVKLDISFWHVSKYKFYFSVIAKAMTSLANQAPNSCLQSGPLLYFCYFLIGPSYVSVWVWMCMRYRGEIFSNKSGWSFFLFCCLFACIFSITTYPTYAHFHFHIHPHNYHYFPCLWVLFLFCSIPPLLTLYPQSCLWVCLYFAC